ncbi:unnamed protein product [Brassica oleracea]
MLCLQFEICNFGIYRSSLRKATLFLKGSGHRTEVWRLINRTGAPFSVRISTRRSRTRVHGVGFTAPASTRRSILCECTLEFRTKVEKSASGLGIKWVYGRIYLVSRPRRDRISKFT